MPTVPSFPRLVLALAAFVPLASGVNITAEPPARAPLPVAAGVLRPHPWPADAFVPVTADRISHLPATEQPAWQAYWAESRRQAALFAPRDLVDHSPTQPLPGRPLGASYSKGVRLGEPTSYYASAAAQEIADRVVNWQTVIGSWVKSGDYSRNRRPDDDHHDAWSVGTFDNDSTIYEMRYLALVAHAAGNDPRVAAWQQSFLKGLQYVFSAQYPNGGFPQIFPQAGGYHDAITFNDDAVVHILELLRDVAARNDEFSFVPEAQARTAGAAVERGIQCVLATQLRTPAGKLLVWGQQHDALTLQPCAARNFEPISACSNESVGLTRFLMSVPRPSPAVVRAVDAAAAWFAATAFHDVAWDRPSTSGNGLVARPGAPDLWARFYELETGRPIFGDRDRSIHYAVGEISAERRLGYAWFNTRASTLAQEYTDWKKRVGR